MKQILLVAVVMIYFFSCKNIPVDEEQPLNDSVNAAIHIEKYDSTTLEAQGIQEWIGQTLKVNEKKQSIKLEEHWKEQDMEESPFDPEAGFYNNYKRVLRWSPDSAYVMDIGSYGMVLTYDKQGKPILEAGEPDTELALIEPGKHQRTRLMFVGPSAEILDAKWIDNKQVMVVGTFDKTGNGNRDTLMWMIDVRDKDFRLYNIKSHP